MLVLGEAALAADLIMAWKPVREGCSSSRLFHGRTGYAHLPSSSGSSQFGPLWVVRTGSFALAREKYATSEKLEMRKLVRSAPISRVSQASLDHHVHCEPVRITFRASLECPASRIRPSPKMIRYDPILRREHIFHPERQTRVRF